MFKEVYDTKEVLLGLRKVYQENRQQLDDLKKYININPRVGDCGFIIMPYNNSYGFDIKLKYTMAAEKGGLLRMYQTSYMIASFAFDLANNKVYTDCPFINIRRHKEFIDKVTEIYNSDFVKLIARNNMKSLDSNPAYLHTTLSEANMFIPESSSTYNSALSYDAYNDQLDFTLFYNIAVNKDFIKKALDDTLNIKFERTVFSNYILENIQEVDSDVDIDICDHRTNANGSRTFIFGIDKQKSMTKAKKLTF